MSGDWLALLVDGLSWALILAGSFFVFVGGVGIVRFPDFYSRLHAVGVTDTLGTELLVFGMMLQAGFTLTLVKLVLIAAFLFFTSPTSAHAVANAAFTAGLRPTASFADDSDFREGADGNSEI